MTINGTSREYLSEQIEALRGELEDLEDKISICEDEITECEQQLEKLTEKETNMLPTHLLMQGLRLVFPDDYTARLEDRDGNIVKEWAQPPSLTDLMEINYGQ